MKKTQSITRRILRRTKRAILPNHSPHGRKQAALLLKLLEVAR